MRSGWTAVKRIAQPMHDAEAGGFSWSLSMLVITRDVQESFMVGDDVRVIIVGIRGGKVRIGIEAPKEVPIVRSELLDREPPHAKTA